MIDGANIVPEAEVKRSVVAEEYSILRFSTTAGCFHSNLQDL